MLRNERRYDYEDRPWKPEVLGDGQKHFDRVFESLDALHQRVMKEGKPAPDW